MSRGWTDLQRQEAGLWFPEMLRCDLGLTKNWPSTSMALL